MGAVASLGWVSPEAATEGVAPIFSWKNLQSLIFSHHRLPVGAVPPSDATAWAQDFYPGVGKFIGVARIFSEGRFFSSKKLTTFLVVTLKTQAKTTKWTNPTLQKIVKIMHK